jgi:cupin fold WbuC family metalloprotein
MIVIDEPLTSRVVEEARKSPRLRMNYNFHSEYSDPINRMLNAMEPGTYLRPHKHESPDKWETFLILSGKALVIRFDDAGVILEGVILDNAHGIHGVEIPAREWHTVVALSSGTVLYEVKPGPYVPLDDKNFASWAPAEGSAEASKYLDELLDHYCLR